MNVMNHIAKVLVASMVLTTTVGCSQDEDATTVGPRGGVITSEDGRFSVEIPAGALDQEIDITIEQVDCEMDESTDALAECYEVGPVGLPLLFPAKVTYEVDDSMFDLVSPEAIAVAVEKEEHWNLLADRKVETGAAKVTASAVYLSAYALVATD